MRSVRERVAGAQLFPAAPRLPLRPFWFDVLTLFPDVFPRMVEFPTFEWGGFRMVCRITEFALSRPAPKFLRAGRVPRGVIFGALSFRSVGRTSSLLSRAPPPDLMEFLQAARGSHGQSIGSSGFPIGSQRLVALDRGWRRRRDWRRREISPNAKFAKKPGARTGRRTVAGHVVE